MIGIYGKLWTQHERISILHHVCKARASRRQIHNIWKVYRPVQDVRLPFGRVIAGWDTLDLLEKVEVNHKHRPLKEVHLKNVTIHANPLAEENVSF